MNTKSALILALILGALYPLGFAPLSYFVAALASILGLYLLLSIRPQIAPLTALAFGLGKYLAGVSWIYVSIHEYGGASPLLAGFLILLFAIGMAFFCWPIGFFYRLLHTSTHLHNAFTFIALWLFMEWLLTWFLTGFPWLFLGYASLDTPLAAFAPVFGVLGSSAAGLASVMGLGLIFLHYLDSSSARQFLPGISLAVLPWVFAPLLSETVWVQPKSSHSVALVQGNVDQNLKWNPNQRAQNVARHIELSSTHWDADLVIWPEFALTLYGAQAQKAIDFLGERGNSTRTNVVIGMPVFERLPDGGNSREYNIYNAGKGYGLATGQFAKHHLVPFGEFVPMEDWLRGLIAFFDLPMSGLQKGNRDQNNITLVLSDPAGDKSHNAAADMEGSEVQAALGICYEIAYGDSIRQRAVAAGLILTISNDTWFGSSIGPHQHMQIARMRALENGRWVLRGTNNGVTGIIDAQGNIRNTLPQFVSGVLRGEFKIMKGRTAYSELGDWPMLALVFVLLLIACFSRWRQSD